MRTLVTLALLFVLGLPAWPAVQRHRSPQNRHARSHAVHHTSRRTAKTRSFAARKRAAKSRHAAAKRRAAAHKARAARRARTAQKARAARHRRQSALARR